MLFSRVCLRLKFNTTPNNSTSPSHVSATPALGNSCDLFHPVTHQDGVTSNDTHAVAVHVVTNQRRTAPHAPHDNLAPTPLGIVHLAQDRFARPRLDRKDDHEKKPWAGPRAQARIKSNVCSIDGRYSHQENPEKHAAKPASSNCGTHFVRPLLHPKKNSQTSCASPSSMFPRPQAVRNDTYGGRTKWRLLLLQSRMSRNR